MICICNCNPHLLHMASNACEVKAMAHRPLSVPLVPGTYLPGYECSIISGSIKGGLSHGGRAGCTFLRFR